MDPSLRAVRFGNFCAPRPVDIVDIIEAYPYGATRGAILTHQPVSIFHRTILIRGCGLYIRGVRYGCVWQ